MSIHKDVYNKIYGNFNIWSDIFFVKKEIDLIGWGGDEALFYNVNKSFDKHIFVDIGVWKGQSSINMAKAIQGLNLDGVVISIDTFLGSIEHFDYIENSGQPNYAKNLFNRLAGGRPDLYETFISNILLLNLQNLIIPLPQTSNNAAKMLKLNKINPTFIHIDASHEYIDVKRDLEDFFEILQPKGLIICDDYSLVWAGVKQAVDEFCNEKNISMTNHNSKAIIVKQ